MQHHMRSTSKKRERQPKPALQQHATCNSRTVEQQHAQSTCRKHSITHLPVAASQRPIEGSSPFARRQIQKDGQEGEKKNAAKPDKNVRLTVQPRTRTEKCWFLLCGQPSARMPVCRRCSLSLSLPLPLPFGGPGSGSRTARRDNPDPVSWECRNTACARKEIKGGNMRAKGGAEREHVCTTAAFLLMHLRLVVGSGPFCPFPSCCFCRLMYCMPAWSLACPAFPFDLEIARTPPGTANQDVSILLCRADLG